MHYIIDGYNLFFTMFEDAPTDENKLLFVQTVCSLMINAKKSGEMVFDTPIDHLVCFPHTQINPPLVISFAPSNLEADDLIIEKLYAIKDKRNICIVTSDRELASRGRDQEVKSITTEKFLQMLQKFEKKSIDPKKPSLDSLSNQDRLEAIFEKKINVDLNE